MSLYLWFGILKSVTKTFVSVCGYSVQTNVEYRMFRHSGTCAGIDKFVLKTFWFYFENITQICTNASVM